MSIKKAVAFLLILFVITFPLPMAGQSGIIVNDADSVLDTSFAYSQDLSDLTSAIGPKVTAEYSDSATYYNLAEVPATLQALVSSVWMMVTVEYADSTAPYDLTEIPYTLQTVLLPVLKPVIVEYADSANGMPLAYPIDLMNDSQPPEISQVTVRAWGGAIAWATDEFATGTVLFGIQTGTYTGTVSNPLYVKQHEITLPGLESGMTYYYKVRSTDRSGNIATSSEYSFTAQISIYLPLVIRSQ